MLSDNPNSTIQQLWANNHFEWKAADAADVETIRKFKNADIETSQQTVGDILET